MTKKHLLIIILLGFVSGNLQSQMYVGNQGFGQLRIISDSTLTLSFYGWPSFGTIVPEDQLCTYTLSHDTMFVSTNNTTPLDLTYETASDNLSRCGEPVIVYCFVKNQADDYTYYYKCACIYDTTTCQIHIRKTHWIPREELYVVDWGYFTSRGVVYPDSNNSAVGNYDIVITKSKNTLELHMRNFPLLKTGKKIIPISIEENEKFWIDNGFYFPTLHAKSNSRYWVLAHSERGLNGLKIGAVNKKRVKRKTL